MDNWIAILIVLVALLGIIGNFSTLKRNAKTPMRKKSLNDLEETLPRSNRDNKKDKHTD